MIDTWCYFSGVSGPDAVVGSAHHTCALWCSAGGIPVGLLGEDGTVYMVLKIDGDDASASGDTLLSLASHQIEADGHFYQRDGLNYFVVENVVADNGITIPTTKITALCRASLCRSRRMRHLIVALALVASPLAAQDFSEGSEAKTWNLYGEKPARFEAKVVDILCELTGDCPDNCGDGPPTAWLVARRG